MNPTSPFAQRKSNRRRGGAILELIIALPILVIGVFAIVEFAILQASGQQLEYASHVGAKLASEDGALASAITLPTDIDDAIRRHLQEAGLETADANIRITLQHNVGVGVQTLESGTLVCPADDEPAPPVVGRYVRVTVCMHIVNGGLTPNLLRTYGF
ncbi:MAG: pilus assembly protein, partial [bacterium]|nr:pilus assembly protein [bacterium]